MPDRWIDLDGLVNMRDVGGLPTRDGGTTVSRRLIRSDNLQDLSELDVDRLVHELGVTDVVDLRTETELHLDGPGPLRRTTDLAHHHHSLLPQRAPESADEIAARALALPQDERPVRDAAFWSEHYLGYLAKRPDSVSAALRVVADAAGAAVVHCAAGKDRTGTVVAMALDVAGVPREEIVADYALSAERIEAIIRRVAGSDAHGPFLREQSVADQTPRAETMEAILDAVADGWGDAAGWLRAQGWGDDDVQRLRARLTQP
ncbi:tyrosine-protein phosphatase [Phycicoccus sp. HDW14]|uniref:tyrosine-protein phosphatase n=1 Tax=Phycicoccus sp. HDW14 TaxID=2714941 RepID=UPI00140905AF|nr:tyrosine-protein phosphatase [Phycicoccus sp. HDW14]QIM21180.1 tyrosine-protein phosphatase [Phycicoccus sp. HDW14]